MKKLVVFTGAGISAESGLKTFRDSDGLWEGYRVEEVATPEAWYRNPELVLNFYNERRRNILQAEPNKAHHVLKQLEDFFEVNIITQNIDNLHERAGSSSVLHLHGEITKMRSESNEFLITDIYGDIHLGDKAPDGAQYRPHVVWFGEPVPNMAPAIQLAEEADIFVIIGTSLLVYPAASLLHYAPRGSHVFVMDKKIPPISRNIISIEKTAVEGCEELYQRLLELK